eukprot:5001430-Pleurochrysis_carterae.AAC.4
MPRVMHVDPYTVVPLSVRTVQLRSSQGLVLMLSTFLACFCPCASSYCHAASCLHAAPSSCTTFWRVCAFLFFKMRTRFAVGAEGPDKMQEIPNEMKDIIVSYL